MRCAIPSPPIFWAPAAISGPSRSFWATPRCRRRNATPTSIPPVSSTSTGGRIREPGGSPTPSGVGLRQGRRGDPQDLVARVLELDRFVLRLGEAGISNANVGSGRRVLGPHHMLAEYFFCHARLYSDLFRPARPEIVVQRPNALVKKAFTSATKACHAASLAP